MSDLDRPGATLPGPVKQRPKTSRFANLGDRLARTFGGYDRDPNQTHDWNSPDGFGYAESDDDTRNHECENTHEFVSSVCVGHNLGTRTLR